MTHLVTDENLSSEDRLEDIIAHVKALYLTAEKHDRKIRWWCDCGELTWVVDRFVRAANNGTFRLVVETEGGVTNEESPEGDPRRKEIDELCDHLSSDHPGPVGV